MELELPSKLRKALEREAADANRTLHAHILRKLEASKPPTEHIKPALVSKGLPRLVEFLNRVPAVRVISSESTPDAFWWVKLEIDISNALAWQVVQELGFVLNHISLQEKLPTVFLPVSPPPYLNGGPEEFLAWVIEPKFNYIDPEWIESELEGRLPSPVEEAAQWNHRPMSPPPVSLEPVSSSSADHYVWGEVCDGWHLLNLADLSVIEELVPPGVGEVRHFHSRARQFFYVLEGQATLEFGDRVVTFSSGQGVHVPPGIEHRFSNNSASPVRFLVVSSPTTRGDRTNAA